MEKNRKQRTVLGYVIIPGILLLVTVIIINIFLYKLEFNFFHNIYTNEVADVKSLISRRIQSSLITAESIKALFSSSQSVTEEEFTRFGEVLLRDYGNVTAIPITVEWIDSDNNIRYIYPMNEDNAKIVGQNLNQYPNRLLPIEKSKRTRESVVTEPIMLQQGYPGFIIYSPIWKDGIYLGQSVVVVRLADLISPLMGKYPIYEKDIYIQTENFIIPFDDDVILNNKGMRVIDPEGNVAEGAVYGSLFSEKDAVSEEIVFADKIWRMRFSPSYAIEVGRRSAAYIAVSLLFGSLIVIFLWIIHKRQEKISTEKAKTEALIASIGDGLVACDEKGVITFANKKAEELSGYSVEESVGRSYYDVWRLFDEKGVAVPVKERLFYRALKNREVVNISTGDHFYIMSKNGKRIPLASAIAPIIVDGRVTGAIVAFRDITKESEVDKMKTEFLSLASHQLLTPSSVIKWVSESLLSGDYGSLNDRQKENIEDIHESNRRMSDLITSLLNISRIESGRIIVDPKPTRMDDLVSEVIKELRLKIDEKSHSVTTDFAADLSEINIDPGLIREVYKNLLTNAIKYTPAKGKISVSVAREGDSIVSAVTDNGYGMTEEGKKKAFEKFYRGENIISLEKDGNGLGLYLVKQILDVSGGKIWLESEIGKGTTFSFSLPILGSSPKPGEVSIS